MKCTIFENQAIGFALPCCPWRAETKQQRGKIHRRRLRLSTLKPFIGLSQTRQKCKHHDSSSKQSVYVVCRYAARLSAVIVRTRIGIKIHKPSLYEFGMYSKACSENWYYSPPEELNEHTQTITISMSPCLMRKLSCRFILGWRLSSLEHYKIKSFTAILWTYVRACVCVPKTQTLAWL
jgi:hypothetical protein